MARPIEILLVEDNPGDVRLTQEALNEGKIANRLNVVGDGEQAMAFLRQEGQYAAAPRPDLILLDLNAQTIANCAPGSVARGTLTLHMNRQ